MDWMFDETFDGKRLWVLTVIDTWSRVCPVMRVCRSATAMELIDALEEACSQSGRPKAIRVDQGSQFTSKEFDLWAYGNGVTPDFSRPGKPTDNAYAESYNAIVRMECLGQHWFLDLDDARAKIEPWRRDWSHRAGQTRHRPASESLHAVSPLSQSARRRRPSRVQSRRQLVRERVQLARSLRRADIAARVGVFPQSVIRRHVWRWRHWHGWCWRGGLTAEDVL
jgi:putative transposase